MKKALVLLHELPAGILTGQSPGGPFSFRYLDNYRGDPVSLTMPLTEAHYSFDSFPPFFEGLLPEGIMLEGLLRERKIDRNDLFSQLTAVGADMPGAVTVQEIMDEDMPDNL